MFVIEVRLSSLINEGKLSYLIDIMPETKLCIRQPSRKLHTTRKLQFCMQQTILMVLDRGRQTVGLFVTQSDRLLGCQCMVTPKNRPDRVNKQVLHCCSQWWANDWMNWKHGVFNNNTFEMHHVLLENTPIAPAAINTRNTLQLQGKTLSVKRTI